jgi:hypothetical protein
MLNSSDMMPGENRFCLSVELVSHPRCYSGMLLLFQAKTTLTRYRVNALKCKSYADLIFYFLFGVNICSVTY